MSAVGPSALPGTECARGPFGPARAQGPVPSLGAACRVAVARGALELQRSRALGRSDEHTVRMVYMHVRQVLIEWDKMCSNLERG